MSGFMPTSTAAGQNSRAPGPPAGPAGAADAPLAGANASCEHSAANEADLGTYHNHHH
jgi:hypothetical protein